MLDLTVLNRYTQSLSLEVYIRHLVKIYPKSNDSFVTFSSERKVLGSGSFAPRLVKMCSKEGIFKFRMNRQPRAENSYGYKAPGLSLDVSIIRLKVLLFKFFYVYQYLDRYFVLL